MNYNSLQSKVVKFLLIQDHRNSKQFLIIIMKSEIYLKRLKLAIQRHKGLMQVFKGKTLALNAWRLKWHKLERKLPVQMIIITIGLTSGRRQRRIITKTK